EIVELLGAPRRADVRPALEHVRFLEAPLGMALLHDDTPGPRPVMELVRRERGREPQVVLLRRLFADAGAAALAHLPREARAAALLQAEDPPAQAVLRRDFLEHRLHVLPGRERAEERLGIRRA